MVKACVDVSFLSTSLPLAGLQ